MRVSRDAVLNVAAGMVIGMFSWLGYRQLSVIDPFQAYGVSGLLVSAVAGGLMNSARGRPVLWAIAGSLAFMILVVAYTPLVRVPAQDLVRFDPVGKVDAVVVLSSSVSDDELLDQQGADRLLTGLQLVKDGFSSNLIVTAITLNGSNRQLQSHSDQARLIGLIAQNAAVITTGVVRNTREEAVEAARIARGKGWRRIALVTSPAHTKRACAAFEKVGLQVVCVPALARDVAYQTLNRPADRLRAFQLWLYESMAESEYRNRGWL